MRYFWLLSFIIVSCYTVFGEIPETGYLSGDLTGISSDTLYFRFGRGGTGKSGVMYLLLLLFLKQPSNIKDTVVYDPETKRYVVMSLIGGRYHYKPPLFPDFAGIDRKAFPDVCL